MQKSGPWVFQNLSYKWILNSKFHEVVVDIMQCRSLKQDSCFFYDGHCSGTTETTMQFPLATFFSPSPADISGLMIKTLRTNSRETWTDNTGRETRNDCRRYYANALKSLWMIMQLLKKMPCNFSNPVRSLHF